MQPPQLSWLYHYGYRPDFETGSMAGKVWYFRIWYEEGIVMAYLVGNVIDVCGRPAVKRIGYRNRKWSGYGRANKNESWMKPFHFSNDSSQITHDPYHRQYWQNLTLLHIWIDSFFPSFGSSESLDLTLAICCTSEHWIVRREWGFNIFYSFESNLLQVLNIEFDSPGTKDLMLVWSGGSVGWIWSGLKHRKKNRQSHYIVLRFHSFPLLWMHNFSKKFIVALFWPAKRY